MTLPILIVFLILVCAYLEYQKNINMNNKIVICLICILTLVVCMCFIDKYKEKSNVGFTTIENFEDEEKHAFDDDEMIAKCIKDSNKYVNEKTYNSVLKNIKSDEDTVKILKNYITRFEKGEKVCWKQTDYITCKNLEKKITDEEELTEDEQKKVDGVCKSELLKECVEELMIKENPKINKKVLVEMRLKDDEYPHLNKEQKQELIFKQKMDICVDCGLDNTKCTKVKEDREKFEDERKTRKENKKNTDQELKQQQLKAEQEELKKEIQDKEKEKIEKENARLKKELEEKENAKIEKENEKLRQQLKNQQSEQTDNQQTQQESQQGKLTRAQQAALFYKNTSPNSFPLIKSGHLLDRYYSSLNNRPPGYSYMDPKLWDVPQKRAPVCHHINELNATPLYDRGTPINVLELTPYGDQSVVEGDVSLTNVGSILPKFEYTEVM